LYTVSQGQTLSVSAPGVLGNDTSFSGNPLTAILVTNPGNGTLTLNANGSFTYTPTATFVGTDSFTYQASDDIAKYDRNAHKADAPGTPSLGCRPFDRVVVVFRVLLSEDSRLSLGLGHASNVRLKDCVALLHPIDWIRRLETRQP
jgi:hypothetical protein